MFKSYLRSLFVLPLLLLISAFGGGVARGGALQDQAAHHGRAVQLWAFNYTGFCIDLENGDTSQHLQSYRCGFNSYNQWFIVGRQGQLIYRAHPTLCVTWNTEVPLVLTECKNPVDSSQQFIFQDSGQITNADKSLCWSSQRLWGYRKTYGAACDSPLPTNQRFAVTYEPSSYFQLRAKDDGDHVVQYGDYGYNVSGNYPPARSQAQSNKLNQYWFREDTTSGFRIRAATNGKCMTAAGLNGGDEVKVEDCPPTSDDTADQWTSTKNADGSYEIANVAQPGLVLDLYRGSYGADAGNVLVYVRNQGDNQKFFFDFSDYQASNVFLTSVNADGTVICTTPDPGGFGILRSACATESDVQAGALDILPNRSYRFRSTLRVLDWDEKNSNTSQYSANESGNQQWVARPVTVISGTLVDSGDVPTGGVPMYQPMGLKNQSASAVPPRYLQNFYSEGSDNASYRLLTSNTYSQPNLGPGTWTILPVDVADVCEATPPAVTGETTTATSAGSSAKAPSDDPNQVGDTDGDTEPGGRSKRNAVDEVQNFIDALLRWHTADQEFRKRYPVEILTQATGARLPLRTDLSAHIVEWGEELSGLLSAIGAEIARGPRASYSSENRTWAAQVMVASRDPLRAYTEAAVSLSESLRATQPVADFVRVMRNELRIMNQIVYRFSINMRLRMQCIKDLNTNLTSFYGPPGPQQ